MNQNMEALAKANEVRLGRVKVKKDILNGKATVIDVLEEIPFVCETMNVMELLSSQKRWKTVRTNKFLRVLRGYPYNAPISETRKLYELTIRERKAIIMALNRKAPQADQDLRG